MENVKEFCNSIMRGVVATGVVTEENSKLAVKIMREEAKLFLNPKSDKYENHRKCVMLGTMSEDYIIAGIVAECVERLISK